jgi:hypothetical protein
MSYLFATGVVLVTLSIIFYVFNKIEDTTDEELWGQYLENSSGIARMLAAGGRPIASSKLVKDLNGTKTFKAIDNNVRMGNTFQSSVDIFVSVQIAALIIGIMFLLFALIAQPPTGVKLIILLLGIIIPLWPVAEMITEAQKRSAMISIDLPEFAELLLMVAPSMSIPAALAFTSIRSKGIVGLEINELVKTLGTRAIPEPEAFKLTADRLATIDGRQFINILENGYLQGSRIVEPLTSLAEQMRRSEFQKRRAYAKKLPVKLIIIFATHFIPFLIGLAFLPVVYGFLGI